jgi:hypothetical protein
MPELDALLERSKALGVYGTKERSVINSANPAGIAAVVKQQFEVGKQVLAHGMMPIIEPEVNIKSETRAECDTILLAEILKNLDELPEGTQVMLKLSLPIVPGTFDPLVAHPKVLRVVALSGGYKPRSLRRTGEERGDHRQLQPCAARRPAPSDDRRGIRCSLAAPLTKSLRVRPSSPPDDLSIAEDGKGRLRPAKRGGASCCRETDSRGEAMTGPACSSSTFAYHRGVAPMAWVLFGLASIELVVVHLLVALRWPWLAWPLDRADRGVSRLDRAVDTVDGAAAPCACRRELAAPRRFAAADQRAAGCYCGCAQKLAGAHKEACAQSRAPGLSEPDAGALAAAGGSAPGSCGHDQA